MVRSRQPSALRSTSPTVFVAGFALALAAIPVRSAVAENGGKALFEARCGECHGPRDIAYWGRTRQDADARAQWFETFLKRHYPPTEAERPEIVRYIQQTIADQGEKK
ncbi:MAG: hypothetical protein WD470_09560 [Rhodospirillaceae bacterium]